MSTPTSKVTVKPRRLILEMPEYHPPLAGRDNALRLDFNENTLAPSPVVMDRLKQIPAERLTVYPEREPVERQVAAHLGLPSNQLLLTNGVDEAIHLVCCAFLEPEDEAIIAPPSFFMYDVSISMMTRHLVKVQADETLQFPFERFLAAINERTKLIVIVSPNNPTGATVGRSEILAIANAAPHAVVLVDEAYFHFHGETVLNDLATTPNLIVARTFSKAYGLANLRIGMLAGSPELIGYLHKVSSPYNVNGVALDCLTAAIEDDAYITWYAEQIRIGRERMMGGLDELGVHYFPSAANFVLMKIGPLHRELVAAMRKRGILLRDRSTDPGCDGYVRITIGIGEHVTRGLEALKASLDEIGWKSEF
ncbi:histidinol-phosphate transaminase [Edaphobacter albus]|uniref:histidinol-phosphate transaminase n=1 Tax=Edaphobacter sp. 4G125 TaxID=2763071 RepID=UPI001646CBFE|nr:histidinol-phosphate transaminase [Edaphobacter sp. 4G125]QNI37766.1 histidinol-phosphate transaminase [Edaphobacter sp. 4G125]